MEMNFKNVECKKMNFYCCVALEKPLKCSLLNQASLSFLFSLKWQILKIKQDNSNYLA